MYTHSDWRKHRSGTRYLHHVATIMESTVVKAIVGPVCWMTCLALAIASYCAAHTARALWMPTWLLALPLPTIAIEPIQLTSIALSLLLVFRTNASYSRWDEARRQFGSITTTSRDLARQAFAWFAPGDVSNRAAMARWLVALCRSSMCHVRGDEHDLRTELQEVLPPHELEWLAASPHRPNFCIQAITRIMSSAKLPSELLIRMDENVSRLVQAVSACERIINTPLPLSYTRHTARFLMAWLACVPWTLWTYAGWVMVPITSLISFVLLGIEEIGVANEEPFSVIALERLCDRVEIHISAMMRECREIQEFLLHPNLDPIAPPQVPIFPPSIAPLPPRPPSSLAARSPSPPPTSSTVAPAPAEPAFTSPLSPSSAPASTLSAAVIQAATASADGGMGGNLDVPSRGGGGSNSGGVAGWVSTQQQQQQQQQQWYPAGSGTPPGLGGSMREGLNGLGSGLWGPPLGGGGGGMGGSAGVEGVLGPGPLGGVPWDTPPDPPPGTTWNSSWIR